MKPKRKIRYRDFECSNATYHALLAAVEQLKDYLDRPRAYDDFYHRSCLLCAAVKHCESCPVLHCTDLTCNYDYIDPDGVTHSRLPISYTDLAHLPRMLQIGRAILRHCIVVITLDDV